METYKDMKNGVFPSVCSLDCPDQCGLLVHKQDGKIVKIEGDPDHPITRRKYLQQSSAYGGAYL